MRNFLLWTENETNNYKLSVISFLRSVILFMLLVSFTSSGAQDLPDWAIGPFEHPSDAQPTIRPDDKTSFYCPLHKVDIKWEARHTFNPAAIVYNGRVHMLYRAEDDKGPGGIGGYTSRLGMAISDDGKTFQRESKPVFYPANDNQKSFEWTGGCEDPRLVKGPDGTFILTYTQYQGKGGGWRIGIANSKDLRQWTKYGSPFTGTSYEKTTIKSAGILQQIDKNGELVAVKINNKYWMYFGEHAVNIATSDDLIHWTPLTTKNRGMLEVMKTRSGYFDSELTEVGPPPILTADGIVLIYNGKNKDPKSGGDPSLSKGVYTCGQALFQKDDPTKLLTRLNKPFFKPELSWEKSGQYAAGTTFAEGLVLYKGRWFLYYGCADTYVGTTSAEADPVKTVNLTQDIQRLTPVGKNVYLNNLQKMRAETFRFGFDLRGALNTTSTSANMATGIFILKVTGN